MDNMLPDIVKNTQDSLSLDSYVKSLNVRETSYGFEMRVNYHRRHFDCRQPTKLGVGFPSQTFVIKSKYHQKRDKKRIEDFMSMKDSGKSGCFDANSTHETFDTCLFSESTPGIHPRPIPVRNCRYQLGISPQSCSIAWHSIEPMDSPISYQAMQPDTETVAQLIQADAVCITSCAIQRGKKISTLADANKKPEKPPEQVYKKKNKWFKLANLTLYPAKPPVRQPVSHSAGARDKESENCEVCGRPESIPHGHAWRTMYKYKAHIILPENIELFPVQDNPLRRYSTDVILPEDVELFPVQEAHKPSVVNRGCQAVTPTVIKSTRTLGNQTSRISRCIPKIRCHNYDPICYQADLWCTATQDDGLLYLCGKCQLYTCRKDECVSQHHKVCKNRDFDVVRFAFHPSTG